MTAAPRRLEATLRSFADRIFLTGGHDPGDAALALPPARLDLYRDLLRGNYRAMLRFVFTCSFRLMDHELAAAGGAGGLPADVDEIIVRFLQVSPSRTHSSREIADRFLVFLVREHPKLLVRRADLRDLMTLERAELRAMFELDDPGRAVEKHEIDRLAAGSLDDLLARTVLRAPSASILRFDHPVVALRAALAREEPPGRAATQPERATVSRGAPPRFPIAFAVHSEEAALVFDSATPGTSVQVEQLATDWSDALPEPARSRDDAWKASTFAAAVVGGLAAGFFRSD